MGYSTDFIGELRFAESITVPELLKLKTLLGEDVRDHDWFVQPNAGLYYIDLELLEDYSGLRWSGAEKSYSLWEAVNVVTREMRKDFPNFKLTGHLIAQGEDVEDRWTLAIDDDGIATRQELALVGRVIKCPHCGDKFVAEEA